MLREDFSIQSEIRRVLVRANINYSKINFGTIKGVVYFRGIFQVSHPKSDITEKEIESFTEKALYSFEKKIRSIPGVSEVIFQFTNWKKQRGQWIPVKTERIKRENGEKKDSIN